MKIENKENLKIEALDLPFDRRRAKQVEQEMYDLSKITFQSRPVAPLEKKPLRPVNMESMLEDLDRREEITLQELLYQIQNIQTVGSVQLGRTLGKYILILIERCQQKNDDWADQQKSKIAPFITIISGIISLGGSFLGAADQAGVVIPLLDKLLPTVLKSGKILGDIGHVGGGVGQIGESFSKAEQTKLEHLYRLLEQRLREIERQRNDSEQGKKQALERTQSTETIRQRAFETLVSKNS